MNVRLNPHDELLALEVEVHGLDTELSVLRHRHQSDTEQIESLEVERRRLRNRMIAIVDQVNG